MRGGGTDVSPRSSSLVNSDGHMTLLTFSVLIRLPWSTVLRAELGTKVRGPNRSPHRGGRAAPLQQ